MLTISNRPSAIRSYALTAVLLLCGLLFGSTSVQAQSIANGDFNNLLGNWTTGDSGAGFSSFNVTDFGISPSGDTVAVAQGSRFGQTSNLDQTISGLQVGQTYTISFSAGAGDLRPVNESSGQGSLQFIIDGVNQFSATADELVAGANNMENTIAGPYEFTFTATQGTADLRILWTVTGPDSGVFERPESGYLDKIRIAAAPGMNDLTIDARAACANDVGEVALENEYYIEVTAINSTVSTGPFNVTIGNMTETFDPNSGTSIFFGPFDHSGQGGEVQVVRAVDQGDDTVIGLEEVPEALCGVRPDGGQASGGFCMTTTDADDLTGAILAQSIPGSFMAGGTSGQVQSYVLVDSANYIVQTNMTGLFTNLPSDTFLVFAVNYRATEPVGDFLATGLSFDPILNGLNSDDSDSPLDGACYTVCDTMPAIMIPVNCLSIGSTVFTDNDDDSIFEPNDDETGIPNVTLNLYTESTPGTGTLDSLVATTQTDTDGNYFFGGLNEGLYTVSVPSPPSGYPISSTNTTTPTDDTEDNVDSGMQDMPGDSVVSPVIELVIQMEPLNPDEPGQGGMQDDDISSATSTSDDDANGDMTVDFGFAPSVSLGSTVFADENDNGVQDPGESGLSDITVNLYTTSSSGMVDSLISSTETDAMGNYFFDMLLPGDYVVGVEPGLQYPVSSTGGAVDPDAPVVDGDDNGVYSDLMMTLLTNTDGGGEVFSGVVALMNGMEPTAADGETAQGSEQDGPDGSPQDANGNMTVDFGFIGGLAIGSTVFFDNDNDGIYEPSNGETGIAGVKVYLYADDGTTVLDSTTTDSEGHYFFGNLTAGDYIVGIPESSFEVGQPLDSAPSSSAVTEEDPNQDIDNNDNGIQPDGAGTLVQSGIVTLSPGEEPTEASGEIGEGAELDDNNDANGNMTVDFGFYPTVSIGSHVFQDIDNSGDYNPATESGIADVQVLLYADVDGNSTYTDGVDTLVGTTLTDADGLYEFDTLSPGQYIVGVIPPADNNLSSNGPAESTADDQIDGNDNGVQEMAGDTVYSTGINLMVGTEPIGSQESAPGGDQDDDDAQDDDGDMTVDFGLLPSVSVGSTVFQDADNNGLHDSGEPGVPGIVITLLDDQANVVARDTTDADGNYFIDGLTPGDYEIVLTDLPDSLATSSTLDNVGGVEGVDENDNGIQTGGTGSQVSSGIFTLTPGTEPTDEPGSGGDQDDANDDSGDMTIDFGLVPNYSIGSTVFADLNNNGVLDADESGVSDVPVTLYTVTDDGTGTLDTVEVATQQTGTAGNYHFENLLPGDYFVEIQPTEALPFSSDEALNDTGETIDDNDNGVQEAGSGTAIRSNTVTLGDGPEPTDDDTETGQAADQDNESALTDASGNQTIDFGLFPGVSVGSTVFADLDNNGMQNNGEAGIADVPVLLYEDVDMNGTFDPATDTLVAQNTTDSEGNYFFDALPEGDYFVGVVPSDDFPVSSAIDEDDPNNDIDNNDNGVMNPAGLEPMAGDTVLSGVVTLEGGQEPDNTVETAQGGNQDDDNETNGNMTVDFAFNTGLSIGSTVFFDNDNDGLLEDSDGEQGIPGVEVFLYAADGTTVLDSTVTDSDGNYIFAGLDEGDYVVGIPESSFAVGEPLEGAPNSSTVDDGVADDQVDNNDNGAQPGGAGTMTQSSVITLMLGTEPTFDTGETGSGAEQDGHNTPSDANGDMTIDFGFFPTMSIGSQVFYDIDNSGDSNLGTEPGVDDVLVLLYDDADGNNIYSPGVDVLLDSTLTSNGGLYEFDTLSPGEYIVAIVPPDTANLSSTGPSESLLDNQADNNDNGGQEMAGDTIYSTAIRLTVGDEPTEESGPGGDQDNEDDQDDDGDMTIDFGILPSVSVGSTVFADLNNNGVQDSGEAGVPGIIVDLLDPLGAVVATDTTDANGDYFIDGLAPGLYQLSILMVPDSLPTSSTDPITAGDEVTDGDDDGIQSNPGDAIYSDVFTLTPNTQPVNEPEQGGDQDAPNGNPDLDNDGNMTFDFGLIPNYSIGSTVFADLNNNTVQDADEDGVPFVLVTLYSDVDGDGYTEGVDTIVKDGTTDAFGNYFFDNLLPGNYVVGVLPTTDLPLSSDEDNDEDDPNADIDGNDNGMQVDGADSPIYSGSLILGSDGLTEPTGSEESAQGGTQDDATTQNDAAGNMTLDFGLFPGVSIGSTVFLDEDADGMHDLNENGISGVLVVLLDESMMVVDSTFTDPDGSYYFDGLQEGNYFVQIPTENFEEGNSLEQANFSSEQTDTEDNQQDGDDNGIQPGGFNGIVTSPLINLMIGEEPTDFDETEDGGAQDNAFDANGDMTVDFGFIVPAFDLALIKELGDDQAANANPGDTVTFTITVFNQGNISAGSIEVTDSIPNGLTFAADLNPTWTLGADNKVSTTLTTFRGGDSLAVNDTVKVDIVLTVDAPQEAGTLINVAEISDDANAYGQDVEDIDSTPDDNLGNDEYEQDNATDGDGRGGEDEDDHDPAFINVNAFDLALVKILDENQDVSASPGDTVLFDIVLINQGVIVADSITIVDFIPDGLNFDATLPENAAWAPGPDMTVTQVLSVENGGLSMALQQGASDTVSIALVLDAPLPAGTVVRNIAEIRSAQDTLGNPQVDVDSDYNEEGEGPDDIADEDDNVVDGTGMGGSDEDESDFADIGVNAFDLALRKVLSPGQSRTIDPGEDVRFDIVVINQGQVAADNIVIRDYLPTNFIISPNETDFTEDASTTIPTAVGSFSVADGTLPAGGIAPGERDTFEITLVLATADAGQLSYFNIAEIESATDIAGNDVEDIDSDYADPNNPDVVEESDDNIITENGKLPNQDEDESDFESVITRQFDLALIKLVADGQPTNVEAGDTVEFTIRIINQGTIGADSIRVSDYVSVTSTGFMFDPSLNPNWTDRGMIAGTDTLRVDTTLTDFNGENILVPMASVDIPIFLVVNPAMDAIASLTNTAEVSDATGPLGQEVIDIDSPMDDDPSNDNFLQDNEINGNGLVGGDEDNSDIAVITVGGFDLALIKTLAIGQSRTVRPGEDVIFDITVINQGAITADSIEVIDYIPDGFLFDPANNPAWTDNGNSTATQVLSINNGELYEGGLRPGERKTVQIVLTVAPPAYPDYVLGGDNVFNPDGVESGEVIVNEAEIVSATDENGVPQTDIDSTPDDIQGNDGEVEDDEENGGGDTNGDGIIDDDEDDHDIAVVTVNCYQDPGFDKEIQVCLGCDGATVAINLFESLGGLPNIGGTFEPIGFVDDDGNPVIIDVSNPDSVVIPGYLDRTQDYAITYTIPAVNDCPERMSVIIVDIIDIQNLSCTGFQNIGLGEDCTAEITPDLVLRGDLTCANNLEVILTTLDGDTLRDEFGVPTAIVGNDQVNQTFNVSLVDPMCDNTCWGQILIEDKQRPTIECPDNVSSFDGVDFICTDIDSILNLVTSIDFTGAPIIADNCTPDSLLDLEFYDYVIPNDDPMCTPSVVVRTFTVTDGSGNFATCEHEITVRPATLADVTVPVDDFVAISCDASPDTLSSGNPAVNVTDQAFVTTALGTYPIAGGDTYCSLTNLFTDGPRILRCENSYEFVRSYEIIDWCPDGGDPIVFQQVIRVGDFDAPVFVNTLPDSLVYDVNTDECSAIIRLDDPSISVSDNCSDDLTITAVIYLNADTTGGPIGTFFLNFDDEDLDLSTAIPEGNHIIRYTYTDGCGNSDYTDVPITIEDTGGPSMNCEDGAIVSLSMSSASGPGTAILTVDNILISAIDACTEVTSTSIAILGEDMDLVAPDYSEYIVLNCQDIGTVMAAVRAEDANGNVNYCMSQITVELKQDFVPECTAPGSVTIECSDYNAAFPDGIEGSTLAQRDALFGAATATGMCATSVTDEIVLDLDACGQGTITRSYVVTTTAGDQVVSSVNTCTQVITIVGDCEYTPAPICRTALAAPLGDDNDGGGIAEVWAADFVASDMLNCEGDSITSFSIYTEEEIGGGATVIEGRTGVTVTCADESLVPVRVYAYSNGTPSDYCSTVIVVQDPLGRCDDGTTAGSIAGVIMTEMSEAIENTTVNLTSSSDMAMEVTTGADGAFMFSQTALGDDYTITPTHFVDYLNGVRTSDIIAITRHILGIEQLDGPYNRIAADVDGTREINVGDIINIRRLILGYTEEFPNGIPSWAFVPADHDFSDMTNPWAEAFPAVLNYNNLSSTVVDADFIGFKMGDVNNTALPNHNVQALPPARRAALELEMDEMLLQQGETYHIPVTAPELTDVTGYQFTLEFDRTALELVDIEQGLVLDGNFGWSFADRGLITTSWNWPGETIPRNWAADEVLFTLVVQAKATRQLSDVLDAGSQYTEAEAYPVTGHGVKDLALVFNEDIIEVAGYRLLQNVPNPVVNETMIGFEMPQAHDKVTITITDASGRLVREFTQSGHVGYNSLRLNKRQLGTTSGVYSYTVIAGNWTATRRLVIVE